MVEPVSARFDYSSGGKLSVFNIKEINSSFSSGSIKVMYLGKNRNKSNFSKESVTGAIPSIQYVPIVCHYDISSNEIGGHDAKVVKDELDNYHVMNLTEPIGVVPHYATYRFEVEQDDNGAEHEYLVVDDVILWKRQEAYSHIVNDLGGVVDHSMEVKIIDGRMNDETGYYDVDSFEFTALCLLEAVEPCFEGSRLTVYSMDEFRDKFNLMINELESYANVIAPKKELDISNNDLEEGGEKDLENKNGLSAECELNEERSDFIVYDVSTEEEARVAEFSENAVEEESAAEEVSEDNSTFELNSNVIESVFRAISAEKVSTPWGEDCRYMPVDFDINAMVVYAFDTVDMKLYAIPYSMNGDNAVVDFKCKKRAKYAIVDYDEGVVDRDFASESFASVAAKIKDIADKAEDFSAKCEEAYCKIDELNKEVYELTKFKNDVEYAKIKEEKYAIIEAFSDLSNIDAFNDVVSNIDNYSVDSLESKFYEIRGRYCVPSRFSANDNISARIPVVPVDSACSAPYGGVVEKYTGSK